MKLHKLSILLIVILAGISFTSCEDEEWVRSRFDISTYPDDPYTNGTGRLSYPLDIYDTYIENYNPRADRILNMDLYSSILEINNSGYSRNGELLVDITTNTSLRLPSLVLPVNHDGYAYIDSGDPIFRDFMYNVINYVINNGYIRMTFNIDTGRDQTARIGIDLSNDLDLYIRY